MRGSVMDRDLERDMIEQILSSYRFQWKFNYAGISMGKVLMHIFSPSPAMGKSESYSLAYEPLQDKENPELKTNLKTIVFRKAILLRSHTLLQRLKYMWCLYNTNGFVKS